MIDFKTYIKELQSVPIDEITEHSKRSALETILNQAATANQTKKIIVLHEPKRKDNYGQPDFKIYTENSIIGYVENKKITENLDKVLKSEQIKKYRELSRNLLITNYIDFVWIKDDIIQQETLCDIKTLPKFETLAKLNYEKVERLLLNFFSQAPEKISSPKELALALALRCKNLKDFINEELTRQHKLNEQDILHELYNAFKNNIFSELTVSEFSDAFAQMITFGLYLAGLNADTKLITIKNTRDFIPANFQLIKELYKFFEVLEQPEYKETKWIIDEIISIINNIQWSDLKQNMRFKSQNPASVFHAGRVDTDPYIYFYETFLATYDHNLRKSKGVYYTPPQVVNFIIRSIDEILINTFNLANGLAEQNKVTVLDFATGTGTFLLEIFKIVLDKIPDNFENTHELTEKHKIIIRDHILKNIYGFEYLIAPYTIAHLKLSQFLKENRYDFADKDRLQVYLTNTLEPVDKQIRVPFMPQLSKETQTAQEIKDKSILVITGNPPYSGISKNNGTWISEQIDKYKFVDGEPLGEKKHWLNDDYVKFMRFAQDKMDKAEQGIVGIITNHSFLDNPTFRGMRQSLINTFDQLYFIDLHGNSSKKETTPDGNKDENIFDIKQGVAISILIKKKGLKKGVFHADFWGDREMKLKLCLNNSLQNVDFNELKPNSPFYFLLPKNEKHRQQYENGWKITDIFGLNTVGIVTARDNFVIDYEKDNLEKRINDFTNKEYSDKEIIHKYSLKNTSTFNLEKSRNNLCKIEKSKLQNEYKKIHYRPFDIRHIFYNNDLIERRMYKLMSNMLEDNLALITVRQVAEGIFSHSYITDKITDFRTTLSNKGGSYVFPLYIYSSNTLIYNIQTNNYKTKLNLQNFKKAELEFARHKNIFEKKQKPSHEDISIFEEHKATYEAFKATIENEITPLTKKEKPIYEYSKIPNFTTSFLDYLKNKYKTEFSPEQILGYIYAILHSQTYRTKYAEFLKSDFPRIPFLEISPKFETLAKLGEELIEKHLMKKQFSFKELSELGNYPITGDNIVVKPEFKIIKTEYKIHKRLYINKTQYFETVTEEIYNFYIGGYQVLDKYLKDRKGRSIADELFHIVEIIKTIHFTIEQMKKIELETKEWI